MITQRLDPQDLIDDAPTNEVRAELIKAHKQSVTEKLEETDGAHLYEGWYNDKLDLLTGLWMHDMNVASLGRHTSVSPSTLRGAMKRVGNVDWDVLRGLWSVEEGGPSFKDFMAAANAEADMYDFDRMQHAEIPEFDPEQVRAANEQQTSCPFCGARKTETHRDHPSGLFRAHKYACGSTLTDEGGVEESRKCGKQQVRNAKQRSQD